MELRLKLVNSKQTYIHRKIIEAIMLLALGGWLFWMSF